MANITERAHDLEQAIRDSEEFQALQSAFEVVMQDDIARNMFHEFRNTQMTLQEKQMMGEDITEEEVQNAKQVVERVQQHEGISALMEKEEQMNQVVNEISQIITKPLEDLYGTQAENENN
ncbi:UPF0342 protein [Lentibacillus sp. JNUCC-1]|uniref:YlbF family regulator n=1 Tax=Lentibacillus sp. JNUCC-1 TaxID=2654513 RepID=UPI0012E8F20C|nr:YlbF family regulator [Lentibacillus sp. JNUCC-1]MUV36629.1 UPF0342 protein [Lentibacillus sp. JNUCC-1]